MEPSAKHSGCTLHTDYLIREHRAMGHFYRRNGQRFGVVFASGFVAYS